MADDKDKKIPEVPHLENVTGKEKIPVSAEGEPRYIEAAQIYDKEVTPYPGEREIVYTTVSGNAIEWEETPTNIISNTYYKDKGFGKIVVKDSNTPSFRSKVDLKSIVLGRGFINSLNCDDCIDLIDVTLNNDATHSGSYRNSNIQFFIMPDSVKYIDNYAFNNCINLKDVIFSSSLESIGWEAFYNSGIVSIQNMPPILTFSNGCFSKCFNLREFKIPTYLETIPSNFIAGNTIPTLIIPSNIKRLGSACLWGTEIENLVVKSTSLTFGDNTVSCAPYFVDWSPDFIPEYNNRPQVGNLRILILRANKVVEDVDTYVSTFTLEEGQELPMGAKLLPKPKAAPMASADGEIMPMTNLDQYIGTPNNWLKIFVPSNLLKAYQERYPTLKNHLHPIKGEDIYAMRDDLKEKEDIVQIETVEGESLEAKVNRYYRFDSPVNNLAVTLPNIPEEGNPRLKSLVLSFTTGDAPQVTISGNADVDYFEGFSIDANKTYELNIMFNGVKWIVAYGVVE